MRKYIHFWLLEHEKQFIKKNAKILGMTIKSLILESVVFYCNAKYREKQAEISSLSVNQQPEKG